MKTSIPLLILTTPLLLAAPASLPAQEIPTLPPPVPIEEQMRRAQDEAQLAGEALQRQHEEIARHQQEPLYAQVQGPRILASRLPGRSAGGPAGKVLILRSTDADSKAQAALQEDLAVMSRVLEKTLGNRAGDERRGWRAMGIDLAFVPGSDPIRTLYLDGYGALFMLDTDLPLLPPPAKPEEPKEPAPVDSAWEEARREIQGQPRGGKVVVRTEEKFDADKVNELKNDLIEAFKSATHIRNLKPDEWVTACVFGRVAGTIRFGAAAFGGQAGFQAEGNPNEGLGPEYGATELMFPGEFPMPGRGEGRGSILTIRAKKADIDAFAKGKLNADEFRKRASLATYAGDVGSQVSDVGPSTGVGYGGR